MATWQDIRAIRHSPPGHASQSGARRSTFGAALQQASEFADAAAASGYATKPVPLYYAMSQAFRAVCAAHIDGQWARQGHGLSVPARGADVLSTMVKTGIDRRDLYSGAMAVVGETPLRGEVSIGAQWAAQPDFNGVPLPEAKGYARPLLVRPAVSVESEDPSSPTQDSTLSLLVYGLPDLTSGDQLMELLRAYPTLGSARPATYPTGLRQGVLSGEEQRNGLVYRRATLPVDMVPVIAFDGAGDSVESHLSRLNQVAPGRIHQQKDIRWVTPAVGDPPQIMGNLSGLWILLFGLSSLARYQPAAWSKALDIDKSEIAVGLERVLDAIQEVLPHYVLQGVHAVAPRDSQ